MIININLTNLYWTYRRRHIARNNRACTNRDTLKPNYIHLICMNKTLIVFLDPDWLEKLKPTK